MGLELLVGLLRWVGIGWMIRSYFIRLNDGNMWNCVILVGCCDVDDYCVI